MFVPVILGSDKTTVSVATGHTEYWPLYASIGNIHNSFRRGHNSGLVLVAFLAIPKSKLLFLCQSSSIVLIVYRQPIKNILIVPTSANFGVGSFMLPWHSFSSLFSLARKRPKCINALMGIFGG
jgi:Plavaka transposase